MLRVIGHRRASYSQEEAKALFDLTMKYARNVVIAARNERDLDYEPYEIQVFNSLDELIRKRPNASAGGLWSQVVVVTRAQAEQPKELENAIFFGDRDYDALNLLEYAATRDRRSQVFATRPPPPSRGTQRCASSGARRRRTVPSSASTCAKSSARAAMC